MKYQRPHDAIDTIIEIGVVILVVVFLGPPVHRMASAIVDATLVPVLRASGLQASSQVDVSGQH